MKKIYFFLLVILYGQFVLLSAQDRVPDRENYNWQNFSTSSSVIKDSIDYNLLQGNWIAHQGSHIGDYKVDWTSDDTPKSLQIKGDMYRNTLGGDFYPVFLDKNLLIFHCKDSQVDSAYINLITAKELTISFKRGIDYDQYRYKK